ncbi:MAG: UDP-N-acetylmuramate:L-alanyl-gamma-D-glutamyl-meso-diaminopimelate ligase [Deltaproteobacteria bacterium]|nr:MAG: UDP-N-acetylmuramate:L-alanyl-gamma-D-glutamyl-meso-diaminopimelate ligase [Deltaproteobacteria bacterium]
MPHLLKPGAHIHFVGICGTAMANVAAALAGDGFQVTGSDSGAYPPMSTLLAERGIEVMEGYAAANIPEQPDLTIIGNAVSRGNPEVERVLNEGYPYTALAVLIGEHFLPAKTPVVVTGTHGKTTTTALVTWLLREGGLNPSWLIGGVPAGLPSGFQSNGGAPFALEGDEYDTAFFDKRPKFIHYRPKILILNNLEYDHADIYPDMERLREVFRHLIRLVPGNGLIIANADDGEVMRLVEGAFTPVERYSLRQRDAEWSGAEEGGKLKVSGPEGFYLETSHNLIGRHQGWNLLASIAGAKAFGLSAEVIAGGVATFTGVKRRGELRGEKGGVKVYDDFAHHPTAIKSTLEGFRDTYPERRIFAVVEPRSNTMRRPVFQAPLTGAFGAVDRLFIREVPNPEKCGADGVLDVKKLAREVSLRGTKATAHHDAGAIIDAISAEASPGDVVVILSNGGFEGIHQRLLKRLEGSC